jgi:hypothetical protein
MVHINADPGSIVVLVLLVAALIGLIVFRWKARKLPTSGGGVLDRWRPKE